jgi:hypothetical protein
MTPAELIRAKEILDQARNNIREASASDPLAAFSIRRYVYKNLSYDERGTPASRTKLKLQKLLDQEGKCAYTDCPRPSHKMSKADEPELDRLDPVYGYTIENTVLVHHECHRMSQSKKRFS